MSGHLAGPPARRWLLGQQAPQSDRGTLSPCSQYTRVHSPQVAAEFKKDALTLEVNAEQYR